MYSLLDTSFTTSQMSHSEDKSGFLVLFLAHNECRRGYPRNMDSPPFSPFNIDMKTPIFNSFGWERLIFQFFLIYQSRILEAVRSLTQVA